MLNKLSIVLILAAFAALVLAACSANKLQPPRSLVQATNAGWLNFDPLSEPKGPVTVRPGDIYSYAGWEAEGFKLVAVDDSLKPAPLPDGFSAAVDGGILSISVSKPTDGSIYIYAFYPADVHPSEMLAGGALNDAQVFLAVPADSGAIAIGVAPITGDVPAGEIARISFAEGAAAFSKQVSAAPTHEANMVEDLALSVNASGGVTATWTEIHRGDYNNDGIVAVSDITPLAQMFNQRASDTSNPGRLLLVDGNSDDVIGIADLTPIAMNFNTTISGYNVYRTKLSSATEDPDVEDTGRWTYINRQGAVPPEQKPSVMREFTGQDFRLPYTFTNTPDEAAYYAYYVRPFSMESDSPNEGPISIVAKTSQPTGMPKLTLEVMNGPFFFLDTDVILRVNLEDAAGAFSVNARLEYRKDVLEFVSASPSHASYDPNLFFDSAYGGDPLFLGAYVGDSATAPANYSVAAFNATKRAPAPTATGTGPVAYFVFRVIGGNGPYAEAFRFPQGTTNIWVWGAQYNVPLPGPQLGPPAMVNITT